MTDLPPGLDVLARASPSVLDLYRLAERAASSRAPILVLGEPGTGRSSLARACHAASSRADGPLVEVDAAAIPASLFESEFFGHGVGAFTGADSALEGRVGRAAGGSLLLDHVEEIPLAVQAKLLRLLSEGRYSPLGGGERRADVRFLAIGTDELASRVAKGSFREDLYYRLEVVTLTLPALRRRRQDLDTLIEFFLADLAERFAVGELELADRARLWMAKYSWPGNLRELRNVLERELVMVQTRPGDALVLDPRPPSGSSEVPRSLVEMEREQIELALAFTRGHQGRAAEVLGISRKALWEKRKRYKLP
ncbi:MAG: sigma 54-interacting transcriptional regulator [Deltaproteobacteria bacterium]|nr:sigma 54-interacting transcriptional regulator [Deltaproteobacteria bacterium]